METTTITHIGQSHVNYDNGILDMHKHARGMVASLAEGIPEKWTASQRDVWLQSFADWLNIAVDVTAE